MARLFLWIILEEVMMQRSIFPFLFPFRFFFFFFFFFPDSENENWRFHALFRARVRNYNTSVLFALKTALKRVFRLILILSYIL